MLPIYLWGGHCLRLEDVAMFIQLQYDLFVGVAEWGTHGIYIFW